MNNLKISRGKLWEILTEYCSLFKIPADEQTDFCMNIDTKINALKNEYGNLYDFIYIHDDEEEIIDSFRMTK